MSIFPRMGTSMAFLSPDPGQPFDTLLTAAFNLAVALPVENTLSQAGLNDEESLPCYSDKAGTAKSSVQMWLAGICSGNNGIVLRFQTYCGANSDALFPCDEASRLLLTGCMNAEYRASSHVVMHIVDSFSCHLLLFKKRASAHDFLAPPYRPHLHCRLPLSRRHHSLCPSQSRTATIAPPRRQIHCQSAKLQQLLLAHARSRV